MTAPIRSYVLRQSRTTPAQRRALTELSPKYGIEYAERSIEPQAIFGRAAPLVAEDWSKPEVTESIVNNERRANVTFRTRTIAKSPAKVKLEAATQRKSE